MKDVPVLLLDEPTASLDADNEVMVQRALDEIARERTVVMIAHRLKTVRGAEQILVLEDGKIMEQGTHDQLAGEKWTLCPAVGITEPSWSIYISVIEGGYKVKQSKFFKSEGICHRAASRLCGGGHWACGYYAVCGQSSACLFSRPRACRANQRNYLCPDHQKVPKDRHTVIIPAIYGLYFLFTGSVYVFIFFMILAVVNELIMLGGGYRNKIRSAVPHMLTWMLNAMGSTLTILLFRDSLVESYVAMGMDAASADAAIASLEGFWLAPQNIAIALIAAAALSIAGYALGMKMLGKHFKPGRSCVMGAEKCGGAFGRTLAHGCCSACWGLPLSSLSAPRSGACVCSWRAYSSTCWRAMAAKSLPYGLYYLIFYGIGWLGVQLMDSGIAFSVSSMLSSIGIVSRKVLVPLSFAICLAGEPTGSLMAALRKLHLPKAAGIGTAVVLRSFRQSPVNTGPSVLPSGSVGLE